MILGKNDKGLYVVPTSVYEENFLSLLGMTDSGDSSKLSRKSVGDNDAIAHIEVLIRSRD